MIINPDHPYKTPAWFYYDPAQLTDTKRSAQRAADMSSVPQLIYKVDRTKADNGEFVQHVCTIEPDPVRQAALGTLNR